jgi:hypothetical protein
MRRRWLPCLLALCLTTAWADELDRLQNINQGQFRLLSEDLGSVLSAKSYAPAAPLGITGFDVGVIGTITHLEHHDIIERASSSSVSSNFPMVQVRGMKGLPWDIDVGLSYSFVPGTNIKYWGGEVRYAILPGSIALPAVSVRGSYTQLNGIDQLDLNTKGLDLSISKKILLVTPYAGAGYAWVESTPKGVPSLSRESFSYPKLFAGVHASLALVGFTFEIDKTGDAVTYGVRASIGF